MYEVVVLNSVAKQLRGLDKPVKNKIITALEQIAEKFMANMAITGATAAIYTKVPTKQKNPSLFLPPFQGYLASRSPRFSEY